MWSKTGDTVPYKIPIRPFRLLHALCAADVLYLVFGTHTIYSPFRSGKSVTQTLNAIPRRIQTSGARARLLLTLQHCVILVRLHNSVPHQYFSCCVVTMLPDMSRATARRTYSKGRCPFARYILHSFTLQCSRLDSSKASELNHLYEQPRTAAACIPARKVHNAE